MSTKIKKIIDPKETEKSIEYGTMSFCSFERLLPYLSQAVNLSENEKIAGIIIDERGLNVKIGYIK